MKRIKAELNLITDMYFYTAWAKRNEHTASSFVLKNAAHALSAS